MHVYKQLVLCCLNHHSFVEVNHPLVGVVHKVNLDSGNAPLGVFLEEVEVLLYCQPRQPDDDAHAFILTIFDKFLKVHVLLCCVGVACALCPTLVEKNVLDAIFCSKVDEVGVSVIVVTCAEIHIGAVGHCAVPPLPAHLSGLNPVCVGECALACQLCGYCLLDDTF